MTVNLSNLRPDIRAEWDELKQHDVLFLLTIRPPDSITANYMAQAGQGAAKEGGVGLMEQYGLRYVRGGEVIEVRDEGELWRAEGRGQRIWERREGGWEGWGYKGEAARHRGLADVH